MKIIRRYILVAFVLFFVITTGSGQERKYDISVAGIDIGQLNITRSSKSDLTYYELHSKIKLWLLFKIEAEYNMTAVYKGDQMISSKSETHSNKGDFKSSTEWDGKQYRVSIDAYEYKKDTVITEPIKFNVGRMYFDKPVSGQRIYADNFGLLIPGETKDDAIVVRILGNANTYHYQRAAMSGATMYHPLKNYKVTYIPKD